VKSCKVLVKHIILENAGQISLAVRSEADKILAVMVVDEGRIQTEVLKTHHRDAAWLKTSLAKLGHPTLSELSYVEWSEEKGFFVITAQKTTNKSYRIDG
jgi:uncharacterized membrane protein YcaP (DUF421 family)